MRHSMSWPTWKNTIFPGFLGIYGTVSQFCPYLFKSLGTRLRPALHQYHLHFIYYLRPALHQYLYSIYYLRPALHQYHLHFIYYLRPALHQYHLHFIYYLRPALHQYHLHFRVFPVCQTANVKVVVTMQT